MAKRIRQAFTPLERAAILHYREDVGGRALALEVALAEVDEGRRVVRLADGSDVTIARYSFAPLGSGAYRFRYSYAVRP